MKISVKIAELWRFYTPKKFGSLIQNPLINQIMRICTVSIIVLATSFQLFSATPVKSQTIDQTKVSIQLNNGSLVEAFNKIEAQSSFHFFYNKKDIKGINNLNISEEDQSIADVLKTLLANTSLSFKQVYEQILITNEPKSNVQATGTTKAGEVPIAEFAKISIAGKVTDTKGQPLPGVSVSEKGTSNTVVTDINGNYKISVTDKKSVLVFKYIGYAPQNVDVGNQLFINVTLTEINSDLNEVVVVGYGTQKRASVTGAISDVKGAELAQAPVDNITSSLAGRVSGVISRQTGGGQPGADNATFSIHGINTIGNNSPLIVVDGIVRNNINQIDPNAIESVTILKDAAAVAPYGLGGANGVVLITTKSGKIGAPTLSISDWYGIQHPTYYPATLDAQDYMSLANEAYYNDNANGTVANQPYPQSTINNYTALNAQDPDKYPINNTKGLFNFKAPEQSHNLELTGGTDKIKYYTDLGFFNQQGMLSATTYTRYAYNMSIDAMITNTTRVVFAIKGSYEINTNVDPATSPSTIFRDSYKLIPTNPLEFSNGLAGSSAGLSLLGAIRSNGYADSYTNTTLSTITVEQKLPVKGLSIKGTFSYDPSNSNSKNWHLPFVYYTITNPTATGGPSAYNFASAISTAEGPPAYIYLAQTNSKSQNFTYQGYLNYSGVFGKNAVTGLFVAEARNNTNANMNVQINNYSLATDELSFGSSNKNDYTIGGSSSTGSSVGYVYRVGDIYDSKYIVEASGRYDGSYYFAPGKQYAFFPAFSAGWVMTEEKFLKNVPGLDYLKLRGSWGKSGMLAGGAFQFLNTYTLGSNAYAYGNGTLVQGSSASSQANPNITWEQAIKTNIGFDGNLLKGLINFSVDAYYQSRSGMLVPPTTTVPIEYGIGLQPINAGSMTGRGIEFTLGSQHRFANGLSLGATGNFSYNTNKLTQTFETAQTYNNPNTRRTGRPSGEQFGYEALGLFTEADDKNHDGVINAADGYNVTQFGTIHPGDIKYADLNGDGKIDVNDQVPIGNSNTPLIIFGLNLTASWKGFDVTAFFQGAGESTMGTMTFVTVPFANNNSNAGYQYFNNHWSPSNPNGYYPRADQAPTSNNTQPSNYWTTSGAYVRLKTAQLGYTIPSKITKALKIKMVRFYVSGQNLLTFSALKFLDPEIGNPVSGTSAIGGAGSSPETIYPLQRVITAGLNATF